MTIEEMYEAANCHRVKHSAFKEGRWITRCSNGEWYTSEGDTLDDKSLRASLEQCFQFQDGWEIIPDTDRCVG